MQSIIKKEFNEHINTSYASMESIADSIENAAKICINSLKAGGKIILFGNGGSAADAQHIAAELVGRYKAERKGFPAIALTTDTSILTCVGNDYGYEEIFARQVEALASKQDVIIAISTGGTSENVVNALKISSKKKCKTIGLSGKGGGKFNELCDVNIVVPSEDTARIQEIHIFVGHTICELIDFELA
tara:strand:+ start:441 stop:1007 length:567 start_codon:yes stop_codon:yes gene_type:complete